MTLPDATCTAAAVLFVSSLFVYSTYSASAGAGWPLPESLVGFWPFDFESGTNDIAHNLDMSELGHPLLVTSHDGPFGQPGTSYSVKENNRYIGYRSNISLTSRFTVSFYHYSKYLKGSGAILEFYSENNPPYGQIFGITYLEPNQLEIRGAGAQQLIGQFPDLLQKEQWNFVAVTYDDEAKSLVIYDKDGTEVASTFVDLAEDSAPTDLYFGHSNWETSYAWMKKTDAIACVMYYQAVLAPQEIAKLPHVCETKGVPESQWPRPNSLLACWPLDVQYNLKDASPNHFDAFGGLSMPALTSGPYGYEVTAVNPPRDNAEVLSFTSPKFSVKNSFTVSFFFSKATTNKEGGLFELLGSKLLQIRYKNEATIEVSTDDGTLVIGEYVMVQQKGAWTFVAFVFDASTTLFSVYGRHGLVSSPTSQPKLGSSLSEINGVRLGYASRWQQGLRSGDAVSCLTVYQAALTAAEICRVIEACRIVHGSVPCGSPKLPLAPIPSLSATAVIPKPGQFPYIAAIRYGSLTTCSASIIDQYWLLTSVNCFLQSNDPSMYKVYVGEQDLAVTKQHTQILDVSKTVTSGYSPRDIALVEVDKPIDFRSDYVNDVCLSRRENLRQLDMGSGQFVFGWGKNGRPTFLSQTLPRFVSGATLTNEQCVEAWLDDGIMVSEEDDFCFESGSLKDKNVPCKGDEGSPMLAQSPGNAAVGRSDRLVQIGIFYQRDADCSPGKPGLFTKVDKFVDWIAEQIACAVPGVAYPEQCPQK